jgi:hypothetical protein
MPALSAKKSGPPAKAATPAPAAKVGGFKRPVAPVAKPKPKRVNGSKYGSIVSAPPRDPLAPYGAMRIRLESANVHQSPVYEDRETQHYVFSVVSSNDVPEGMVFKVILFKTNPGKRDTRYMTMALVGLDPASPEDNDAFNEFNKDGGLYASTLGDIEAGGNWIEANGGNQTLIGRMVDVIATQGNPCVGKDGQPTGDHYRNFAWSPIPEEEQEVPLPEAPEEYWVD